MTRKKAAYQLQINSFHLLHKFSWDYKRIQGITVSHSVFFFMVTHHFGLPFYGKRQDNDMLMSTCSFVEMKIYIFYRRLRLLTQNFVKSRANWNLYDQSSVLKLSSLLTWIRNELLWMSKNRIFSWKQIEVRRFHNVALQFFLLQVIIRKFVQKIFSLFHSRIQLWG